MDGKPAPALRQGMDLVSRPYVITIKKTGYAEVTERVTPIVGQTQTLNFELLSLRQRGLHAFRRGSQPGKAVLCSWLSQAPCNSVRPGALGEKK